MDQIGLDRRYKYFVPFALCYLIGELLQIAQMGPLFLRWHLSDFGYPFWFAFTVWWIFRRQPELGLTCGVLVGCGFELFQFTYGRGDPIDMIVFLLAGLIGYIVLSFTKKREWEIKNE